MHFFLFRRDCSFVRGMQWTSLSCLIMYSIGHLASPTSISGTRGWEGNRVFAYSMREGTRSLLPFIGYQVGPAGHGSPVHTADADPAASPLLSVRKAFSNCCLMCWSLLDDSQPVEDAVGWGLHGLRLLVVGTIMIFAILPGGILLSSIGVGQP